jgi:hypothetical protein
MNRSMAWLGKVDAKAIYGSLNLSSEETERAIVSHVVPVLGSIALGVGLYMLSTAQTPAPFGVVAFALPAAAAVAALTLLPGRGGGGVVWFAPLAMAIVYLAARPEVVATVGIVAPLAVLALALAAGAALLYRRIIGALDLGFALLFAPAALASPGAREALRATFGDGAALVTLIGVILVPAVATMAARRQLLGTTAGFAALGFWSLQSSGEGSPAPGVAQIVATVAAVAAQIAIKAPGPQSDIRLAADQFLFAGVLLLGVMNLAAGLPDPLPVEWAMRAWAFAVIFWQIARIVRRPSDWPGAAAIGWSALAVLAVSYIAWPWPDAPSPVLGAAAALGIVALAALVTGAAWRLRVTDLMKAYFAGFAGCALYVFVRYGLNDTLVGGLAPPVGAPAAPALLALGLAGAAASPFIMQLPVEKPVLGAWRGFVAPRTAARLRRFFAVVGATLQRLPFVSSFGALAGMIWTLLQHLRGRNGAPLVTELVLIAVTLVLARIFAHMTPLAPLVLAQGSSVDPALAASVARAVAFGVTLFVVGSAMGSRFFVYLGLIAVASPMLTFFTSAPLGAAPIASGPISAARVGGVCLAMAAGLLTCELVRLTIARLRPASS